MTEGIDLKKWIYSEQMAEWMNDNILLDAAKLADCICIAPHRTMREKRKELKKLYENADDDICKALLKSRIERICAVLSADSAEVFGQQKLFRVDIYYMGQKEELLPDLFFHTQKAAIGGFLEYIKKNVREKEDRAALYYAAVSILSLDTTKQQYQELEQFIVRADGEMICSRETMGDDFSCQRLPYPSGTILSSGVSPFLPPIKGVLVNQAEPEESNFAENDYGQWLICSQTQGPTSRNGICIVNLTDYYNPFSDTTDCNLPYKQLFSVYEGRLDEKDLWLAQLSRMVREDKTIMNKMLYDRRPSNRDDLAAQRLAYMRSLSHSAS